MTHCIIFMHNTQWCIEWNSSKYGKTFGSLQLIHGLDGRSGKQVTLHERIPAILACRSNPAFSNDATRKRRTGPKRHGMSICVRFCVQQHTMMHHFCSTFLQPESPLHCRKGLLPELFPNLPSISSHPLPPCPSIPRCLLLLCELCTMRFRCRCESG